MAQTLYVGKLGESSEYVIGCIPERPALLLSDPGLLLRAVPSQARPKKLFVPLVIIGMRV